MKDIRNLVTPLFVALSIVMAIAFILKQAQLDQARYETECWKETTRKAVSLLHKSWRPQETETGGVQNLEFSSTNANYKLHRNRDYITISTVRRISEGPMNFLNKKYVEIYSDRKQNGSQLPIQLAKMLFEIEGVTSLDVGQYELSIEKASMFEWDNLLKQIVEVLDKELPVPAEKG